MSDRPILPPRLKRGDSIGLFCPAGPVRDVQRLRAGIKLIEDIGFAVKVRGPVEPGLNSKKTVMLKGSVTARAILNITPSIEASNSFIELITKIRAISFFFVDKILSAPIAIFSLSIFVIFDVKISFIKRAFPISRLLAMS